MKGFFKSILLLVISILFFTCSDQKTSALLDQAETLLDAGRDDEAYILLDSIDRGKYQPGSHQQARYALLYTRALYKNYIISPSDSLISLAVDYAEKHGDDEDKFYAYLYQGIVRYELMKYEEASVSLIRAMEYSDHIMDYYSTGQMYGILSLINTKLNCTDGSKYGEMAYNNYVKGEFYEYAANALVLIASNKLQFSNEDSCRLLLDSAITIAKRVSSDYVLQQAYSLMALYAITVDSILLADRLYDKLNNELNFEFSARDLCYQAILQANKQQPQKAQELLAQAQTLCLAPNDSITYYASSFQVYDILGDHEKASMYRDILFDYEERFIDEQNKHSSIAAQCDYIEKKSQEIIIRNQRLSFAVIILLLSLLFVSIQAITIQKKRKIQKAFFLQTLRKIDLEKKLYAEGNKAQLLQIKNDSLIEVIKSAASTKRGLRESEWQQLTVLFNEKLPSFEISLRELMPMNETEWHICMLLKLSFSPGDISALINRTPGAVSSARIRMLQKALKRKGSTTEWDSFIESL